MGCSKPATSTDPCVSPATYQDTNDEAARVRRKNIDWRERTPIPQDQCSHYTSSERIHDASVHGLQHHRASSRRLTRTRSRPKWGNVRSTRRHVTVHVMRLCELPRCSPTASKIRPAAPLLLLLQWIISGDDRAPAPEPSCCAGPLPNEQPGTRLRAWNWNLVAARTRPVQRSATQPAQARTPPGKKGQRGTTANPTTRRRPNPSSPAQLL